MSVKNVNEGQVKSRSKSGKNAECRIVRSQWEWEPRHGRRL